MKNNQSNKKLLHNSLIQNLLKKKLTKMMEISSPVIKKSSPKRRLTREKSLKEIRETPIYQNTFRMQIKRKDKPEISKQIYQKSKFIQKISWGNKKMFLLKPEWVSNITSNDSPVNAEQSNFTTNEINETKSDTSKASDEWIYENSTKYCGNLKNITNWYQNRLGRSNSRVLLSRTPEISFLSENIPGEVTRNKNLYVIRQSQRLKTNVSWNLFDTSINKVDTNNEFVSFNPVYKKWNSKSNIFRIKIMNRSRRTSRLRY